MRMNEAELVAHHTLQEKYLRKYSGFLEQHSNRLIHLLEDFPKTPAEPAPPTVSSTKKSYYKKSTTSSYAKSYAIHSNFWDHSHGPIEIVWGPFIETINYNELINSVVLQPNSTNPDVQKVLLVLVSLSSQLKELHDLGWKEFVYQLMLYGEPTTMSTTTPSNSEGDGHLNISHFLPKLFALSEFISKVSLLLGHTILQLESLFKDSVPQVVGIDGVHFISLFDHLGNLLGLIIILDEIITCQSYLIEHWTKYKRMITTVRGADSGNFDLDSQSLFELERELDKLDREILSGKLFSNILTSIQNQMKKTTKKHAALVERFLLHFNIMEKTIESDFMDGSNEFKPINLIGLFLMASILFPNSFDVKKTFTKKIWPILRKIPGVPIGGTYLWTPEGFLNSFQQSHKSTHFFESKLVLPQAQLRHSYLEDKIIGIKTKILHYHLQVHGWTTQLQEIMCSKELNSLRRDDLSERTKVLLGGIKLAQALSHNFRLTMNLHATLGKAVSPQLVSYLIQHLELLKVIQSSFLKYNVQICHSVLLIMSTIQHIALTKIHDIQQQQQNGQLKDNDQRRDGLTVLTILESVLFGPPSTQRLLIASHAFDWVTARCYWAGDDKLNIIQAALERLQILTDLLATIQNLCNGSSLYWHRQILPSYFNTIYSTGENESTKLSIIYLILQDCLEFLYSNSTHLNQNEIEDGFTNEILAYFKGAIVDKLCTDVEVQLRLQTHSHLQIGFGNPTAAAENSPFRLGNKDFNSFLEIGCLEFSNYKLCLKRIIEYYLSKNFYNLASVALHDWQSYSTMRVLAKDKFRLDVIEDYLPGHSLEQGLDILAIVRNFKKFVMEYSYNLNNQVFIQITSPNKHLETVGIRHLANSMRTHGPGMSNSTINCAYKFLKFTFQTLSQFLYDEQIKSRLAKDIRTFKQQRQNQEQQQQITTTNSSSFPYEKAEKFQKGIRKLGLSPDGLSPLDQFRLLVTHIGNTLGFVRLVRSGGLHYLGSGSRFLPDFENINEFSNIIKNLEGSGGGKLEDQNENLNKKQHAENEEWKQFQLSSGTLISSITSLSLSGPLATGVNYFQLLVRAFHDACKQNSGENNHLKNFYVIIPALTLSYVDHMRLCKEKLSKKSKSSTQFTDDGFPMGLAYLLKVLDQDSEFDSLQWFSGVTQKLLEERSEANKIVQESKHDEKLQHSSNLTAKRVQDLLQEFHLLRYNLSSARIFFQGTTT